MIALFLIATPVILVRYRWPMAMKSNWLSPAVPVVAQIRIPAEVELSKVQVAITAVPD